MHRPALARSAVSSLILSESRPLSSLNRMGRLALVALCLFCALVSLQRPNEIDTFTSKEIYLRGRRNILALKWSTKQAHMCPPGITVCIKQEQERRREQKDLKLARQHEKTQRDRIADEEEAALRAERESENMLINQVKVAEDAEDSLIASNFFQNFMRERTGKKSIESERADRQIKQKRREEQAQKHQESLEIKVCPIITVAVRSLLFPNSPVSILRPLGRKTSEKNEPQKLHPSFLRGLPCTETCVQRSIFRRWQVGMEGLSHHTRPRAKRGPDAQRRFLVNSRENR